MYGQLGHGIHSNEILPRQVMELMGSTVTQVNKRDGTFFFFLFSLLNILKILLHMLYLSYPGVMWS